MTGRKGPSVGQKQILTQLLDYTIETFFPEVSEKLRMISWAHYKATISVENYMQRNMHIQTFYCLSMIITSVTQPWKNSFLEKVHFILHMQTSCVLIWIIITAHLTSKLVMIVCKLDDSMQIKTWVTVVTDLYVDM